MGQNETNEKSADNQEQLERERTGSAQGAATPAAMNPLTRRSFFGRVSASTAVAATGVGVPFLLGEKTKADDGDDDADDPLSRRGRSSN
jgi:hypothetical protein